MAMNVPSQYGLSTYETSASLFVQSDPPSGLLDPHPIQYTRWSSTPELYAVTHLLPTQLVLPARFILANNAPGAVLWL